MQDKERPFGVKLIFLGTLLAGILGLLHSLFISAATLNSLTEKVTSRVGLVNILVSSFVLLLLSSGMFLLLPILWLIFSFLGAYLIFGGFVMGSLPDFLMNEAQWRTVVCIFSIFNFWLSYNVYELKKIAWYVLLYILFLALIISVISLFLVSKQAGIFFKAIFAVGIIINLCWFIYVRTIRDYFPY